MELDPPSVVAWPDLGGSTAARPSFVTAAHADVVDRVVGREPLADHA
jgi:hypothetical protein